MVLKALQSILPRFRRSRRKTRHRRPPPGSPPGTLQVSPEAKPTKFFVCAYGPESYEEIEIQDLSELARFESSHVVFWLRVEGLGTLDRLQAVAQHFQLHALLMEDVVNVYQRPKVDFENEMLFLVLRILTCGDHLDSNQFSLFLGKSWLVSFQEQEEPVIDQVRERIQRSRGRIRQAGVDYLTYVILDTVMDGYFPVLDQYSERLEAIEELVMAGSNASVIADLHAVRRDILAIRRCVWPKRDVLNMLIRDGESYFSKETRTYLRDCYDHAFQMIDFLETYREISADLMELHLSMVNLRMNEVMKVLTIIATIFLPLTFLTGLYGMNFDTKASPWNMPELHWRFGYPFALSLMAVVVIGFVWYFRRQGWVSEEDTKMILPDSRQGAGKKSP